MAIEFPSGRRMHIARICGVNRNDKPVPDIWVDVLRIERIKINTQDDLYLKNLRTENQEITIRLKWKDDEGHQEEFEDGGGRNVVIVKVCSPEEENLEDPEEWVPIATIKKVFLGDSYKGKTRHFFDSILADKNRSDVEIRKFSHYDTSIDDKADEAFRKGDTVFVVPVDEYEFLEDSKDEEDYLEHEVVLKSNLNLTPHWEESLGSGVTTTFTFKHGFLVDGSDEPEDAPDGEINPPWRLDPFQHIINCQFTPAKAVMIGTVRWSQVAHTPATGFSSATSDNGQDWTIDEFGGKATAASGFGRTVVASGGGNAVQKEYTGDFVVFGNPDDGDRCFIHVRAGGEIRRGVMEDGELEWSTVGELSINPAFDWIESLSFAGGAFFVSYNKLNNNRSLLAVSFDGLNFRSGVDRWKGVDAAAQNGLEASSGRAPQARPQSGNVVHDEDRGLYVSTGTFQRTYAYFVPIVGGDDFYTVSFDDNFMSSTSKDGYRWTPVFELSESDHQTASTGQGKPNGNPATQHSSTAFGNGVFVATGGKKVVIPDEATTPPTLDHSVGAAAIVSLNGTSWEAVQLPRQVVTRERASLTTVVVFVKQRVDEDHEGYFIIGDVDLWPDGTSATRAQLWYSLDGRSWQSVVSAGSQKFGWTASIIHKRRGTIEYV